MSVHEINLVARNRAKIKRLKQMMGREYEATLRFRLHVQNYPRFCGRRPVA